MRSTGDKIKKGIVWILLTSLLLCGCGDTYPEAFTAPIAEAGNKPRYAAFFAEDLCVPEGDVADNAIKVADDTTAGLFNLTKNKTVFAKDVYKRINPASLTKIMTALVAIENGDLTKTIVATPNVGSIESGAQRLGLKEGDRMTLDQALHILLIHSSNDVAILIAESVAGSVDRFARLMNERAQMIGATGCHFTNPHGLTESEHYVTAYDMYLIFNEAMKYKEFREIVNAAHYSSSYHNADGTEVPVDLHSTNSYLTGGFTVPEGVTIIGGKTGTTSAAGHCLILYTQNRAQEEYIAVVMGTPDAEALNREMTELMQRINN